MLLAANAKEWGVRPSSLLTISEPVVALVLDDALHLRLDRLRAESRAQAQGSRSVPPPGFRFESAGDWRRPLRDVARQTAMREAYLADLAKRGVKVH